MLDYLSALFIRFFINPFSSKNSSEYRYLMNDSSTIILSCPAEEKNKDFGISIKKFSNLFKNKPVTILYPEHTVEGCKIETNHRINDYPKKINYNPLHFIHSHNLDNLYNKKCDVFIDLDPNFNLLNILLCRQLNPAVRISFNKPNSSHFYNIRYNINPQKSYSENRSNLYTFLRSMMNKK